MYWEITRLLRAYISNLCIIMIYGNAMNLDSILSDVVLSQEPCMLFYKGARARIQRKRLHFPHYCCHRCVTLSSGKKCINTEPYRPVLRNRQHQSSRSQSQLG